MKVRSVRVHPKDGHWTDVHRVTETYVDGGLFTAVTANGERFRFPIDDIRLVTETPPAREERERPPPVPRRAARGPR